MLRRLIIFLVRKKLGLKKNEGFQFVGQKSDDFYWFTNDDIMKFDVILEVRKPSSVSLHWLLNDDCMIVKVNNGVDI